MSVSSMHGAGNIGLEGSRDLSQTIEDIAKYILAPSSGSAGQSSTSSSASSSVPDDVTQIHQMLGGKGVNISTVV